MVARRHHYIPQFYLKGFSVGRKKNHQVVVFDCNAGKSFQTATRNVAVETDFNRVEIEGHPPDAIEKEMAEFESEAASALARIIAAKSIQQDDDRTYLLNLIGLLETRNPRMREVWRDFKERLSKQIMAVETATPERWASLVAKAQADGYLGKDADTDYEKMRTFVTEDQYTIEVPTGSHIANEMIALDAVLPYMFKRKWLLLKCSENSGGFVTSDHPVRLMWSDPEKRGPIGHGLRHTEIIFPICTRLAVVGAFEIENDEVDASEEAVAAVNGALIRHAERHVYARDYHFHYALGFGDVLRKGSKLIADRRLKRTPAHPAA